MSTDSPNQSAEDKTQAERAMPQVSMTIGRFVIAWSELETRLRALELMVSDTGQFKPVDDLEDLDLIPTVRFMERVRKVIGPDVKIRFGKEDAIGLRGWFKELDKVRNRVIHGTIVFHGRGRSALVPTIFHGDYAATMMASRGYPGGVTKAMAPNHKNSMRSDRFIPVSQLDGVIRQVEQVGEVLTEMINGLHRLDG